MALPTPSADTLAPYVTVLRAKDGKFTEFPAVLEPGDVPGHHAFAILCPQPAAGGTVTIAALERHPHSTQSFVPIRVGRWIVLAAPTLPDGNPDVANIRAAVAGPEDAICIGRDVWHAGLTVLDRPAEIAMMMWKADAGDDGILYELNTPITLSVD
jgi:ureidoglycolate lyase